MWHQAHYTCCINYDNGWYFYDGKRKEMLPTSLAPHYKPTYWIYGIDNAFCETI